MLPWYFSGINQKTLDVNGFTPILSNRGDLKVITSDEKVGYKHEKSSSEGITF